MSKYKPTDQIKARLENQCICHVFYTNFVFVFIYKNRIFGRLKSILQKHDSEFNKRKESKVEKFDNTKQIKKNYKTRSDQEFYNCTNFVGLMISNKTRALGLSSVAIIAAIMVVLPMGAADAIGEAVDKARILTFGEDESIITLKVNPTEDLDDLGFKGYAILTADPDTEDVGTLIAITRHGGVYDSQTQTSPSDNNWHAHYVELIQQDECVDDEINPDGLAVDPFRISFTEPGKVIVKEGKNGLVLKKAQTVDYIDINYAFLKDPLPALPTDNIQKYTLGDVGDG